MTGIRRAGDPHTQKLHMQTLAAPVQPAAAWIPGLFTCKKYAPLCRIWAKQLNPTMWKEDEWKWWWCSLDLVFNTRKKTGLWVNNGSISGYGGSILFGEWENKSSDYSQLKTETTGIHFKIQGFTSCTKLANELSRPKVELQGTEQTWQTGEPVTGYDN